MSLPNINWQCKQRELARGQCDGFCRRGLLHCPNWWRLGPQNEYGTDFEKAIWHSAQPQPKYINCVRSLVRGGPRSVSRLLLRSRTYETSWLGEAPYCPRVDDVADQEESDAKIWWYVALGYIHLTLFIKKGLKNTKIYIQLSMYSYINQLQRQLIIFPSIEVLYFSLLDRSPDLPRLQALWDLSRECCTIGYSTPDYPGVANNSVVWRGGPAL